MKSNYLHSLRLFVLTLRLNQEIESDLYMVKKPDRSVKKKFKTGDMEKQKTILSALGHTHMGVLRPANKKPPPV